MAARYAASERDFRWVGWIGGSAGLIRAGKLTLFGSADVETVIGNERARVRRQPGQLSPRQRHQAQLRRA
jgi:hypothetical protein